MAYIVAILVSFQLVGFHYTGLRGDEVSEWFSGDNEHFVIVFQDLSCTKCVTDLEQAILKLDSNANIKVLLANCKTLFQKRVKSQSVASLVNTQDYIYEPIGLIAIDGNRTIFNEHAGVKSGPSLLILGKERAKFFSSEILFKRNYTIKSIIDVISSE